MSFDLDEARRLAIRLRKALIAAHDEDGVCSCPGSLFSDGHGCMLAEMPIWMMEN